MTPNIKTEKQNLINSIEYETNNKNEVKKEKWNCFQHILWLNVIWFTALHIKALYGLYLCFTETKFLSIIFTIILYYLSMFGLTAGVHRLWSHRSYKAVLPLRIILAIFNSMAFQNSIYEWGRDHRVHHKYTESDADPVNSLRGFFFSHCGWLMCAKHPDVKGMGGKLDLTDLLSDPVVRVQKQYYWQSVVVFCFLLPTVMPFSLWSESLWNAYFVCVILRYVLALNCTWFVNSVAHMWGYKPYDIHIAPVDNPIAAILTIGEGYHNFHHSFPWDYSTSEWGWNLSLTTFVLDQLAKVGWVYDTRQVTKVQIELRKSRTGPKHNDYEK